MRICGLSGLFSGESFIKCNGRKVKDASFQTGPVDIVIDEKSGNITKIEKSHKSYSKNNDRVFRGDGFIATAGFIDSHTHSFFAGNRSDEFFLRWKGATYAEISKKGGGIHRTAESVTKSSDDDLCDSLLLRLNDMALSGSTTVEIKSGYGKNSADELRLLRLLKRTKERNSFFSPHTLSTFVGLHALPKNVKESIFVDEMISILPTVAKEGLADFVDAFPEKGLFSLKESLRFIQASKKFSLPAKIHADEITPMKAAETFAKLGALSVDHLQKISKSAIEILSKRSSHTVATLLPATSFFLNIDYAPARKIIDAGARVALASDYNPGTAPLSSLKLTRLLAASQFKMNAVEIYAAITLNAAASLGIHNKVGALLPGMRGDILLWKVPSNHEKNFLESIILSDQKPEHVFLSGRRLSKI